MIHRPPENKLYCLIKYKAQRFPIICDQGFDHTMIDSNLVLKVKSVFEWLCSV